MPYDDVRVGCAGWSILKNHAAHFPGDGSHLTRYSQSFSSVEINTSFYRPHRASTYARWASESSEGFRFSVKIPKEITHKRRLDDVDEQLDKFLDETSGLGEKRGPLLIQLPPSLAFDARVVKTFFSEFRRKYQGSLVCEPRHESWFTPVVDRLLAEHKVGRVAADPAVVPRAAEPGGWHGLAYYRLHGSPKMYYDAYSPEFLNQLAITITKATVKAPIWCIFDNTANGAATTDALDLLERLRESSDQELTGKS